LPFRFIDCRDRYSRPCEVCPLELLPWQQDDRFLRSSSKPESRSRRLHAGRRLGSLHARPQPDPGTEVHPGSATLLPLTSNWITGSRGVDESARAGAASAANTASTSTQTRIGFSFEKALSSGTSAPVPNDNAPRPVPTRSCPIRRSSVRVRHRGRVPSGVLPGTKRKKRGTLPGASTRASNCVGISACDDDGRWPGRVEEPPRRMSRTWTARESALLQAVVLAARTRFRSPMRRSDGQFDRDLRCSEGSSRS